MQNTQLLLTRKSEVWQIQSTEKDVCLLYFKSRTLNFVFCFCFSGQSPGTCFVDQVELKLTDICLLSADLKGVYHLAQLRPLNSMHRLHVGCGTEQK